LILMLESESARTLVERLRFIRVELYGETGVEALSARLGIPSKTWANYESGVAPAAPILLRFIEITGVHPLWLLDGREPRHLVAVRESSPSRASRAATGSSRADWAEAWIDRHRGRAAAD
jgi:hypothetical protein